MKIIVCIYPHQLFQKNPALDAACRASSGDIKHVCVYLVRDNLFFRQYNFHSKKIQFHTDTMREYKTYLEAKGYVVYYAESTQDALVHARPNDVLYICDVVDDYLERDIHKAVEEARIDIVVCDSPLFLLTRADIKSYETEFPRERDRYAMRNFYSWQRKRTGILVEVDASGHKKPTGGVWNLDTENRKRIPKDIVIPTPPPGINGLQFATTFAEAQVCLDVFLHERLANFGPYEDAIHTDHPSLFHSVLSPYINCGLLTPQDVLDATILFYEKCKDAKHIPLSSVEGFIRQILGWREFMRYVYVTRGREIRTKNYFNAHRAMPNSFYTGTTGLDPFDHMVQRVKETAYDHHIPRLMVAGNLMTLCGIHPDAAYQWFMEFFIDAYDWVMVPNVYSMALYADGGMITTKPYISGSSYITKMSNFKKVTRHNVESWDEVWDSLFWNFVSTHYDTLASEGRLGFIGVTYAKMSASKKNEHRERAKNFLHGLT